MRIAIGAVAERTSAQSTMSSPGGREGARRDDRHAADASDIGPDVTVTLSASALAQASALEETTEEDAPLAEASAASPDDGAGSAEAQPRASATPSSAPLLEDRVARRPRALFRFAKASRSTLPPSAAKRASSRPPARSGRFRAWSPTRKAPR
jgi:hypothetical protein